MTRLKTRKIGRGRSAPPSPPPLRIVILGLSITSTWGNGHATTYRGLVRELAARGNDVLFLERDMPWYSSHRDLAEPPYCRTALYGSPGELRERFEPEVRGADLVIVGSYVPDGVVVAAWVLRTAEGVTAFYDIDTPITMAMLERNQAEYVSRSLLKRFDVYLSFTGGPLLKRIERRYGARSARPLYCSVDPWVHSPEPVPLRWDVGYMGTYSDDRQPAVAAFVIEPARAWAAGRFAVAGPLYPDDIAWPDNVERIEYLPAQEHRAFYNAQRFTLNITRADMVAAGYSPSVRLFEAAACGVPIISDWWDGIDTFFEPGREILIARSGDDVLRFAREIAEPERIALGHRARARVLGEHTAAHRAAQLERYASEVLARRSAAAAPTTA
jgi:spore maturation protein CgeB